MDGKTVVITGANSGIGRAIADGIAAVGARVIMVCRSKERGEKALCNIVKKTGNVNVELVIADLSTRDAIRALADDLEHRVPRLDVLVNNAGVIMGRRKETPEGFETTFFVNHLAGFLLTNLLSSLLIRSAPARVVNIASSAHSSGTMDFDDLQLERGYKPHIAYANSKLANILFTYELARRLEGTGVTANCVHPGVIHTNILSNVNSVLNLLFHATQRFFKQPEDGAETPVYLVSSPEVEGITGKYFKNLQQLGSSEESYDRNVQRRLWETSEQLLDYTSPLPPKD